MLLRMEFDSGVGPTCFLTKFIVSIKVIVLFYFLFVLYFACMALLLITQPQFLTQAKDDGNLLF